MRKKIEKGNQKDGNQKKEYRRRNIGEGEKSWEMTEINNRAKLEENRRELGGPKQKEPNWRKEVQ